MIRAFYILFLFPIVLSAQFHINIGYVDIEDKKDKNPIAWNIGYDQYFKNFGAGINVRYTGITGDNYYSLESNIKHRIINEGKYRMDIGGVFGHNLDDKDFYTGATLNNSIRIDPGTWITFGIDNNHRKPKYWNKWRNETYLTFGVSLDITKEGQKNLSKNKRFY